MASRGSRQFSRLLLCGCALGPTCAIRLVTIASLPDVPPARATAFLQTPANWPKVVLSSQAVKGVDGVDVTAPLPPGASVDEVFGAPPVLPLSVRWTCTEAVSGERLVFSSPDGLAGVATACKMEFSVAPLASSGGGCTVELAMSYEPVSPIAALATPLLAADNALALKVLLGRAMERVRRTDGT